MADFPDSAHWRETPPVYRFLSNREFDAVRHSVIEYPSKLGNWLIATTYLVDTKKAARSILPKYSKYGHT